MYNKVNNHIKVQTKIRHFTIEKLAVRFTVFKAFHERRNNREPTHHREVGVHGIQLQVDLFVDSGLGFLMVVLSHFGSHCFRLVSESFENKVENGR